MVIFCVKVYLPFPRESLSSPYSFGCQVLSPDAKLAGYLTPGGRLNKKDSLSRYGDSHVKDKTS